MREVARRLLEDDEVEGEALAQRPHHGELVQEAVLGNEGRVLLGRECFPAAHLVHDRVVLINLWRTYHRRR